MTKEQWDAIEDLLSNWFSEICDECDGYGIATCSTKITSKIEEILNNSN